MCNIEKTAFPHITVYDGAIQVSDGDSINTAIAKFRLNISNAADVVNILNALRKKVHQSPEAAVEAARGELAGHMLGCVEEAAPDDEVRSDIANVMLPACEFACAVPAL